MILAATQTGISGGSQGQCEPVVFEPPDDNNAPENVLLTTATNGAHIFYTIGTSTPPPTPTHSGDSATGVTQRIGSNSGTVYINKGYIGALAYKPGLLDSIITQGGSYIKGGGGGG